MANAKPKKESLRPSKVAKSSLSFPHESYESLKQIVLEKKVSVAWSLRDAAEKYVTDKWPLLEQR